MLWHALGREFKPRWWQTLFQAQAQHLRFLHDSIWLIWFDAIICLPNLSCEWWNRKLEIKKLIFKILFPNGTSQIDRKLCTSFNRSLRFRLSVLLGVRVYLGRCWSQCDHICSKYRHFVQNFKVFGQFFKDLWYPNFFNLLCANNIKSLLATFGFLEKI